MAGDDNPRLQGGDPIPVIPKSAHRERITENAQLFDFRLSDEEIAELDALDRTGGIDRALERTWWRS